MWGWGHGLAGRVFAWHACVKQWVQFSALHKLGVVVHICHLSTGRLRQKDCCGCKGGLGLQWLESVDSCWTECSPLSLNLHSMEGR